MFLVPSLSSDNSSFKICLEPPCKISAVLFSMAYFNSLHFKTYFSYDKLMTTHTPWQTTCRLRNEVNLSLHPALLLTSV